MQSSERLKLSVGRAFEFLKAGRNPDGLWSDFLTLAGESVYWVSGYVGYSVARRQRAPGEEWIGKAGSLILEHQGRDGGWGYGPGVPSDADSTSWCLLFLSGLGTQGRESRQRALSFLSKHQSPLDGGFRTYAMPREVGRYMMLDQSVSFEGWASSQTCVTAAATRALIETGHPEGVEAALDHIRESQTPEGYWNSYWWSDRLYATVNCMEVLRTGGLEGEDTARLDRARAWIEGTQLSDGGWSPDPAATEGLPFSTALAVAGLLKAPRPCPTEKAPLREAVGWLLFRQMADGGWGDNHILRIPHPSTKDPWNQPYWRRDGRAINAVIRDHRRLFTTATAFGALSELVSLEGDLR